MEQAQVFSDIREALARLERRMDAVRNDVAVDFRWIVAVQVTTLVAVVAALLAR